MPKQPEGILEIDGMLVKRDSKGQTPIAKIKHNNRAYTNKAEIADHLNKLKNWKSWRKSDPIHKNDST